MLDVDTVVPFLLELGLIDVSWIVDGTLSIRSVARRNRNLMIEGPDGVGFLIKQPDDPTDGGRETLCRESAFHEFCRDEPSVARIIPFLARLVHHRAEEALLVFELIPGAASLHSRLRDHAAPGGDVLTARAFGEVLGTIHRVLGRMNPDGDPRLAWLPRALPSVLTLHEPAPELLAELSPANREMLRILQSNEVFGAHLERIRRLWGHHMVIHGDIRLDNVLAREPRVGDEADWVGLWIIDWEMVGLGDPGWDLAGALQDFLVAWVSSMPLSDGPTVEELAAGARLRLADLQVCLRAMWSGYRKGSELDPDGAEDLLGRAVAYSAARLIQSAYERAAAADRLSGHTVLLLQIAENLAAEPGRGQIQLLGIPPGYAAS